MAITRDDQVLCVTEYSRIVPLENGEVGGFGRPSHQRLKNELDWKFCLGPQVLPRKLGFGSRPIDFRIFLLGVDLEGGWVTVTVTLVAGNPLTSSHTMSSMTEEMGASGRAEPTWRWTEVGTIREEFHGKNSMVMVRPQG